MSAPEKIWVIPDDNQDGCCPLETDLNDVGPYFDADRATEYTRTDLSQAAVAAALESAAVEADKHLTACSVHAQVGFVIRALITPAQHDALAAHVAAEVAKARAEDAAKIEALETAAKAGAELAAYASYSEIVGAIGHNRPQIREWCDKVFAANHVLRDIEWKALTSTHEATQIGAKP